MVYDFDLNAWWPEFHKREIRFQRNHEMHGYTKPYFLDETGRVFRDETGKKDHNDTIPMEIELGENNFNSDLRKTYTSVAVDSIRARTAYISYALDGGEWHNLGQLDENNKVFTFPHNMVGTKINYLITHNDSGEGPIINGVSTYYSTDERYYGQTR